LHHPRDKEASVREITSHELLAQDLKYLKYNVFLRASGLNYWLIMRGTRTFDLRGWPDWTRVVRNLLEVLQDGEHVFLVSDRDIRGFIEGCRPGSGKSYVTKTLEWGPDQWRFHVTALQPSTA
jgi:hypothetical protein